MNTEKIINLIIITIHVLALLYFTWHWGRWYGRMYDEPLRAVEQSIQVTE
jgi:hypothetical protein